MHVFLIYLAQISIGLIELFFFLAGALGLGFAVHFFWISRKNLPSFDNSKISEFDINEADEWRLRFYEEVDIHEKKQEKMRREMSESLENEKLLQIEVEELKKELKRLQEIPADTEKPLTSEYIDQLLSAQEGLTDHNELLNRLLEQVDLLRQSEKKHLETQRLNENLQEQLREVQQKYTQTENELRQIRQERALANELQERLRKAYDDFALMQEKISKLEGHIAKPQMRGYEYDELQQAYFKLTKEFDELKGRQLSMVEENQRLSRLIADAEDKLRESNFVRQQLSKKVAFLDELNTDLQQVASQNKKIEMQLRRISEIEQLLMKVPDEENPPSE